MEYVAVKKHYAEMSRKDIERECVNDTYNGFLSDWADFKSHLERDQKRSKETGRDKRIPYIGWFWRRVNFFDRIITIGEGEDGFVGFMENNKWDYPQRDLTEAEFDAVVAIIDEAREAMSQGGLLSKMIDNAEAAFDKLYDYMQKLEVA